MKITVDLPAKSKKFEAMIAFLQAFKIKYELPADKKEKSPYNPEFVKKIKESQKEVEEGKVTRVKVEDLEEFFGL